MSEYYTFDQQFRQTTTPSNPLRKLPPGMTQDFMAHNMSTGLASVQKLEGVGNCCLGPQPCKTWVQFRPTYSGCGNMWVRWDELNNLSAAEQNDLQLNSENFEVGQKAQGIWVADLNPIMYEHKVQHGAIWKPEPYAHPHARQMFAQFLMSTLVPQSDPNTKRVGGIQDTLAYTSCKFGKPQYTTF